jgi:hypothetical protein
MKIIRGNAGMLAGGRGVGVLARGKGKPGPPPFHFEDDFHRPDNPFWGLPWMHPFGNMSISGNKGFFGFGGPAWGTVEMAGSSLTNCKVQSLCSNSPGDQWTGIGLRFNGGAGNGYALYAGANGIGGCPVRMVRFDFGVATLLGTYTDPNPIPTLQLSAVGNVLTGSIFGVPQLVVVDGTYPGPGFPAVVVSSVFIFGKYFDFQADSLP